MAVILDALRLRPGSLRLMGLRIALLGVSALIPTWVARSAVTGELGDLPTTVPMSAAVRTWALFHLGSSLGWMLVLSMTAFLICDQLLTAALAVHVDPRRDRGRVWRTIWNDGLRALPAFLRIAVVCGLLGLAGTGLCGWLFSWLGARAHAAGATGLMRVVILPGLQALLTGLWLAAVGAYGLWCRTIVVADNRRRARRVMLMVTKVFWRTRGAALVLPALVIAGIQLAGLPLLWWHWLPGPRLPPAAVWVVYLAAQVVVWHAVVHGIVLAWSLPHYDDLRVQPDEPWHLAGRLRRRFSRRAPVMTRGRGLR